jgi:hypothetical protein
LAPIREGEFNTGQWPSSPVEYWTLDGDDWLAGLRGGLTFFVHSGCEFFHKTPNRDKHMLGLIVGILVFDVHGCVPPWNSNGIERDVNLSKKMLIISPPT